MNAADISKFLSYVLRHRPDTIGLTLDVEGWASIEQLLIGAVKDGKKLNRALLDDVVFSSEKKRFSISEDGLCIRAVQGHSTTDVSISRAECIPPEILYHGTAERFMESICKLGLNSGQRQHVHLSLSFETAHSIGQRHGRPIVLKIEALKMHQENFKFFKAENGVWLTAEVPPKFFIAVT